MAPQSEWIARVDRDYHEADHYINNIIQDFNDHLTQLSLATQIAYQQYFKILGAKSSKPIILEVLFNFLIFVAPEILGELAPALGAARIPFGPAGRQTLPGMNLGKAALDKYKHEIEHLSKKYSEEVLYKLKGGEALAMTKELGDEVENGARGTAAQNQISAGSAIIKKLGGDMLDLESKVRFFTKIAQKWIEQRHFELMIKEDGILNMLTTIKTDVRHLRLDIFSRSLVNSAALAKLSDQILYDMLHAYVERYVTFTIVESPMTPIYAIQGLVTAGMSLKQSEIQQGNRDSKALKTLDVDDLPTERLEEHVDGLDDAQRDAIYERFGSPNLEHAIKRPHIEDYKDLIWAMGAKTINRRGNQLFFH